MKERKERHDDKKRTGAVTGYDRASEIGDMKSCIEELDDGYDPITSGWEDGMGNVCNIDGWS